MLSPKTISHFWSKAAVKGEDDCWEWLAGKTKFGHGVFYLKRKWIGAHRMAFLIQNGFLPSKESGLLIMHDCENPGCVNPKHLLEGTVKQNSNYPGCLKKLRKNATRLMVFNQGPNHVRFGTIHSEKTKAVLSQKATIRGGWHKGLKRSELTKQRISLAARGENSSHAKLTDEKVKEIFFLDGKYSAIARIYGIDPSIVSRIKARKAWKHLTENLK